MATNKTPNTSSNQSLCPCVIRNLKNKRKSGPRNIKKGSCPSPLLCVFFFLLQLSTFPLLSSPLLFVCLVDWFIPPASFHFRSETQQQADERIMGLINREERDEAQTRGEGWEAQTRGINGIIIADRDFTNRQKISIKKLLFFKRRSEEKVCVGPAKKTSVLNKPNTKIVVWSGNRRSHHNAKHVLSLC